MFAIGYPGLLFRSTDRGTSWQMLITPTDDALFAIAFKDAQKGVVVGRAGMLLTTQDGGKSWAKKDTGVEEHLFDVTITPAGDIVAVGHFGTIVHSKDFGETFATRSYDSTMPPAEETGGEDSSAKAGVISIAEEENEGAIEEARLNSVVFTDAQHGWIFGEFGLILHSADGGLTWKRQRSASGMILYDSCVRGSQHLLAVGAEGALVETTDGGQSWTAIDPGTKEHILSIWPVNKEGLYLVGQDGMVLFRKNATDKFKRLPTGIFSWLGSVLFLDEKLGFVAGGRGYLLKTTDGGTSWTRLAGR
jgi:photosystem II stability/assembly factor-like uncharacterized protein